MEALRKVCRVHLLQLHIPGPQGSKAGKPEQLHLALAPSPAADQSPAWGDTITCFSCLKGQRVSLPPGHTVGASRENRVQGQKRQSNFPCFLNYMDSLKQMWSKWSFLLPGQISCHVSMTKPRCIICLAIMQTTSSQAENKAQLDVGTRRQ